MTAQKDAPLVLADDATVEYIPPNLGGLAAALAKAQTQFATVTRDKTVTVKTKTGGSYTFSYAPLDTILAAVRGPLSDNGLVLVQMLDEGSLVTTLVHESGAFVTGRIGLPPTTDIQAFGSAVTYLRRYAIQAMLGIAAEDDDDGNRAAGNEAKAVPHKHETTHDGGLVGTAEIGTAGAKTDFELRQTPDGHALGFRLRGDKGGIKVVASDPIASALAAYKDETVGQRVTVWGRIGDETFTANKGKDNERKVTYQVLTLERIRAPWGELPGTTEPESLPAFSDAELADIASEVDAA